MDPVAKGLGCGISLNLGISCVLYQGTVQGYQKEQCRSLWHIIRQISMGFPQKLGNISSARSESGDGPFLMLSLHCGY
jgi:hypothetical protein